jgi:hypothetical protein
MEETTPAPISRLVNNPTPDLSISIPDSIIEKAVETPKPTPRTPAEFLGLDLDRQMFARAQIQDIMSRPGLNPLERIKCLISENIEQPANETQYQLYLLGQYEQAIDQRRKLIQLFGLDKQL